MNDPVVGFNVILEGESGSGKTHALGTLVDTGLQVHTLFTEAGAESLYGYFTDRGKEIPPNLHVHQIHTQKASFSELMDSARKSNTLTHKLLSEMQDPHRSKYDGYLNILSALNDYEDQRTGERFGSVDSWGLDRVIAIDGLSGINRAAMQLIIGGKAVRGVSEWGQAQFYVEELLHSLTNGCRCHFVLIAHQELETDVMNGGMKKTVATLGKALVPKIPQLFSDVILCERKGDKWSWSTADTQTALKTRNLPISANIKPDFAQILSKWQSRMSGVTTKE